MIVMADLGSLTSELQDQLSRWIADGGTLVRFAGPRLAAADDNLVPVTLRRGDRVLGGTMSWQQPQALASFSAASPFAGLTVPGDVTVNRQVLAEPDGTLASRTWAALGDGTPLVTAAQSGKGWLVLFHVTADTTWSNLPLSGTFVEMLRRIVAFAGAHGAAATETASAQRPYRLLDGSGHFSEPTAEAEAVSGDLTGIAIGPQHPPRALRVGGRFPCTQPAQRGIHAPCPRRSACGSGRAPLSDGDADVPDALVPGGSARAHSRGRACGAVAERRVAAAAPCGGHDGHSGARSGALRAPRLARLCRRSCRHLRARRARQDASRLCRDGRRSNRRHEPRRAARAVAGACRPHRAGAGRSGRHRPRQRRAGVLPASTGRSCPVSRRPTKQRWRASTPICARAAR